MTPSRLILSSTLLLGTAMISPAAVYLNEFMVDNPGRPNDRDALLDMDGKSPAWIELRNNGPAAVALTGWALTDDPAVPGKWSFAAPVAPATTPTTIPAGGYLIVFCGGLAACRTWNCDFRPEKSDFVRAARYYPAKGTLGGGVDPEVAAGGLSGA